MILASSGQSLRRLLFPPACCICQQPIVASATLCASCSQSITPLVQPRLCPRCALPLPEDALPGCCARCLTNPPAHRRAVSLFAYRDSVREAILHWKLGGDERTIHWLLQLSTETLRHTIQPHDLLLPIPMPLSRMRRTGQHHAANLCRMIADITGCEWDWRWLRRNGDQPRQSSLTWKERRANLRRAFMLDDAHCPAIESKTTIWLVDDIMTTGSTLHFAARTLAQHHTPCSAFTLARTLRNH